MRWLGLMLLLSGPVWAQDFVRTVAQAVVNRPDAGPLVVCVTWATRKYTFRVDQAGSARTPGTAESIAIDNSFDSWRQVSATCSDFELVRGPDIVNPEAGEGTDSANVITFREKYCRDVAPSNDPCYANSTCGNRYRCWDHEDFTIALTTTSYSTRTGIATDSDIEMNGAGFLFTTRDTPPCTEANISVGCVATDIQNTMTHEIGHVLGLDHVVTPSSTMAESAPLGETQKRRIDTGTAAGFCLTYPQGKPPVPCDALAQQRTKIVGRTVCSASSALIPFGLAMSLLRRRRVRVSSAA